MTEKGKKHLLELIDRLPADRLIWDMTYCKKTKVFDDNDTQPFKLRITVEFEDNDRAKRIN